MTRVGLSALIAVAQAELARAERRERVEHEQEGTAAPATPERGCPTPASVAKRARARLAKENIEISVLKILRLLIYSFWLFVI